MDLDFEPYLEFVLDFWNLSQNIARIIKRNLLFYFISKMGPKKGILKVKDETKKRKMDEHVTGGQKVTI